MDLTGHASRNVKAASTISLLAGIWLFVSPWVYSAYHMHQAWNSWVLGFAIALFAAIRIGNPEDTAWLSWLNCLLGAWTFVSPWIFAYTGDRSRFVSSLCVGAIVVIMALRSAIATPHGGTPLPTGA